MRQKKAKAYRRIVERITVGSLQKEYEGGKPPVFVKTKHPESKQDVIMKAQAGVPMRLKETCTRAVYLRAKRLAA